MNVLSDDERSRVLLLYDEGKGIREIERETGIHRDTISRHVGGFRSKRPMLACLDRMWTWLEDQGIEATDVDGYVDLQVLIYSCVRHPRAIAFEDVDDTGCRFCIKDQLKEHHRRHKEAGAPIVPPRRVSAAASLLAPPSNPRISTQPNKTQTIVNIIEAQGPISREDLFAEMGRLFGHDYQRAKELTSPLLWQITGARPRDRVRELPDGRLVVASAYVAAVEVAGEATPEPTHDPPRRIDVVAHLLVDALEREASDAPAPQEREATAVPATANARPATSDPPEPPLVLCTGEPEPHVRGLVEITYGRDEEAQREDPPAMSTPREAQAVVPLAPDRTAPDPDVRRAIATRATVPTFAATPAPPVKTVRRAKPKAAAPEDDEELDAKPSVTAASANRKARANQNAQGLAEGESRMRVCASIKCARSSDRVLGKFQSPAGVRCARCGTTATEGRVVQGAAA